MTYTVEPGRNIYKNGKPWIYVSIPKEPATNGYSGALPAEADDETRRIAALLNQDEGSRKVKTILLGHGIPSRNETGVYDYRVEKVTDSVEFHPRQVLLKSAVDKLCQDKSWKVTIVKIGE